MGIELSKGGGYSDEKNSYRSDTTTNKVEWIGENRARQVVYSGFFALYFLTFCSEKSNTYIGENNSSFNPTRRLFFAPGLLCIRMLIVRKLIFSWLPAPDGQLSGANEPDTG